jgi:hypothetical protein
MLDGGVDYGAVAEDLMERLADLRSAGVLGQVAAGAGPERLSASNWSNSHRVGARACLRTGARDAMTGLSSHDGTRMTV